MTGTEADELKSNNHLCLMVNRGLLSGADIT